MQPFDTIRMELGPGVADETVSHLMAISRRVRVRFLIDEGKVYLDQDVPAGTEIRQPAAPPRAPRGPRRPGRRPGARKAAPKAKGLLSIACKAHKADAGRPCSSTSTACRDRRRAYREGAGASTHGAAPADEASPASAKRDPLEILEETEPLPEAPTAARSARLLPEHPGNPMCACKPCVAYRAQQRDLALLERAPPMRSAHA